MDEVLNAQQVIYVPALQLDQGGRKFPSGCLLFASMAVMASYLGSYIDEKPKEQKLLGPPKTAEISGSLQVMFKLNQSGQMSLFHDAEQQFKHSRELVLK